MGDMIDIRPGRPDDVPVILNFIRALAEYEKLAHTVTATEDLLREQLFGPRPAAEVLLALVDSRPMAFALYFQTYSTFVGRPGIWVEDLFVLPESRGQGIGIALLKAVANIAVQQNCGRLEWSVLDWNTAATGFYKKLGAQAMDDWTTYRVTGDALAALGAPR
jgi:GNAT superfamily N-acetyltransferase